MRSGLIKQKNTFMASLLVILVVSDPVSSTSHLPKSAADYSDTEDDTIIPSIKYLKSSACSESEPSGTGGNK